MFATPHCEVCNQRIYDKEPAVNLNVGQFKRNTLRNRHLYRGYSFAYAHLECVLSREDWREAGYDVSELLDRLNQLKEEEKEE